MSETVTIVNVGTDRIDVNGDLTFYGINKKVTKPLVFPAGAKRMTVNLVEVRNADSAGLALLIEWIKQARNNRIKLAFKNTPNQILNLAKLSGLENSNYFDEHSS